MPSTRDSNPVRVPIDEELAIYANDVDVWHTPHDIVLDLYVLGPREAGEDERASMPVGRVRLAPTIVFTVARELVLAMTAHEEQA